MKVISGGQNGADIAGVRAAKKHGIETGGNLPKGWRTLDGPRPEYGEQYGMVEHPTSSAYPPRTFLNVKDSDGTIRFVYDFKSAGEICTMRALRQYDKPYFDVLVKDPNSFVVSPESSIQAAIKWIRENNIRILNVAGNSEKTCPGMETWVERYLSRLFEEMKGSMTNQ